MRFITSSDTLTIDFVGAEQLWSLKGKLVLERKDIQSIKYVNKFNDWHRVEIRAPGTYVPGAIVAGSYLTDDGWDFVYVTNPQGWLRPKASDVLLIKTAAKRYRRVILSCSFVEAQKVIAWWNSGRETVKEKAR